LPDRSRYGLKGKACGDPPSNDSLHPKVDQSIIVAQVMVEYNQRLIEPDASEIIFDFLMDTRFVVDLHDPCRVAVYSGSLVYSTS
jgi:hypothetical protein